MDCTGISNYGAGEVKVKIKSLINCESALSKLCNYAYIPAKSLFYLSSVTDKIQCALNSYHKTRNSILSKYGETTDNINYIVSAGDMAIAYNVELSELESQEVDISFPPDKITLCVESIDRAEKDLPPDKRLGFSANDWAAIQEVIKVVETEE